MAKKTLSIKLIVISLFLILSRQSMGQMPFPLDSLRKANETMLEGNELKNNEKTILGEKKINEAQKLYSKILIPYKKFSIKLGDKTNYNLESVSSDKYIVSFLEDNCNYMFWLHRKSSNTKFITSDKLIEQLEMADENSKIELTIELIPASQQSKTYISSDGQGLWLHTKLLSVRQE